MRPYGDMLAAAIRASGTSRRLALSVPGEGTKLTRYLRRVAGERRVRVRGGGTSSG